MLQTTPNYLYYTSMSKFRRNLVFIGKLGHCCSKDQDIEWKRAQKNNKIKIPQVHYTCGSESTLINMKLSLISSNIVSFSS